MCEMDARLFVIGKIPTSEQGCSLLLLHLALQKILGLLPLPRSSDIRSLLHGPPSEARIGYLLINESRAIFFSSFWASPSSLFSLFNYHKIDICIACLIYAMKEEGMSNAVRNVFVWPTSRLCAIRTSITVDVPFSRN